MTWVKLDDAMPEHPKVVGLSDAAFRVHISAICYVARNELDGRISAGAVRQFGWTRKVRELVEARLWDPLEDGFEIHDYLEYNPSRAESEERRARAHEGKVAGGRARAAAAQRDGGRFTSSPPAERPAENQQPTSPVPDPVPLTSLSVPPTPHRTGLTDEQDLLRIEFHAMVRDQVNPGFRAPDTNWCEDLIRRGATLSDCEYAVQAALGKGEAYCRRVLERRVVERENGVDHDQLARDSARDARREPHGGSSRARGVARNGAGSGSFDEFGDAPEHTIRASADGGDAASDSSSRAPIRLTDRARQGGSAR